MTRNVRSSNRTARMMRLWGVGMSVVAGVTVGVLVGTLSLPQNFAAASSTEQERAMVPAPAVAAAVAPIDCSTPTIFLAQGLADGDGPTQLNAQQYTLNGSVFVPLGTPWTGNSGGQQYNAIGYNQADGFLYGIANPNLNGTYDLLRIGGDGSVENLGPIAGMPTDFEFINNGVFFNGDYYVGSLDHSVIYKVDIATTRAAPVTLSALWTYSDFTQVGDYLWGSAPGRLGRLDPATGQVTNFPWNGIPSGDMDAGAVFTFGNGNFGINSSVTGKVSQVAISNPASASPTFTLISQITGPLSQKNDGTSCLPNPFDADLGIVKSGTSVTSPGGDLSWDITVTNNGPAVSSGYTFTDQIPAGVTNVVPQDASCYVTGSTLTCVGPVLLVGASQTFHITATAPSTDGTITNVVSVLGNETDPVPTNNESSWQTRVNAASITLVKSADSSQVSSPATPGDMVTYSFTATNTGTAPLTGVTITDPLPGLSVLVYGPWPGAPNELSPGESVTATATYRVTQADINTGEVANTATATGTPPTGPDVTDGSSADVPLVGAPGWVLTKAADVSGVQSPAAVGDVITYSFAGTNTGSTTLTGVTITDPLPGLSALTFVWPGAAGVMLPGQVVTATATYALTQADLDAGHVTNTATGTALPPTGPPVVPVPPTVDVPLVTVPGLVLTKTADVSAVQSPAAVGDVITYGFTGTNTGSTTLTGVVITDPLPGLSALSYVWPGAVGVLLPGQVVTASATYGLTQADLDAGHVSNTATGTGVPPTGPPVATPPASTDTPLVTSPKLELVKTADTSRLHSPVMVGDVITYSFTVRNTGNLTISNVALVDPLPGLSPLTNTWPGSPGTLLPGQAVTASATYSLTQADIDAGHVDNTAYATGTTPDGGKVPEPPSASVDTLLQRAALPAVSG